MPPTRLKNSKMLNDLESFLCHLSDTVRAGLIHLIEDNLSLFSDHPRQTFVTPDTFLQYTVMPFGL